MRFFLPVCVSVVFSLSSWAQPPAEEILELGSLIRIGERYLEKFDREIQTSSSLFETQSYGVLQALHVRIKQWKRATVAKLNTCKLVDSKACQRLLMSLQRLSVYKIDQEPITSWPEVQSFVVVLQEQNQMLQQRHQQNIPLSVSELNRVEQQLLPSLLREGELWRKQALSATSQLVERETRLKNAAKPCYQPSRNRIGNIVGSRFPEGRWALTYDDGPHPSRSEAIMDLMKSYRVEATFFWLSKKVNRREAKIRPLLQSGSELANHTYDHPQLTKVSNRELRRQIITANDELKASLAKYSTTEKIKFFRLPYGAGVNSTRIRNMITRAKLVHVFWNVDSLDWQDRDPQSIFNRIRTQMERRKGGVILLHDIHRQTIGASQRLLEYVKNSREHQLYKLSDVVEVKQSCR